MNVHSVLITVIQAPPVPIHQAHLRVPAKLSTRYGVSDSKTLTISGNHPNKRVMVQWVTVKSTVLKVGPIGPLEIRNGVRRQYCPNDLKSSLTRKQGKVLQINWPTCTCRCLARVC